MITFHFNGIDFSDLITVNEISGRGILNARLNTVKVPKRHGSYLVDKTYDDRIIDMQVTVKSASIYNLRDRVDELNMLLHTQKPAPLVFSDENDMTYHAVLSGNNDFEEIRTFGRGTISFVCPDPFKYKPSVTTAFSNGAAVINNGGAEPVLPIVTANVTADITHLDVFTDEKYMRIGRPADISEPIVDPKPLVFHNTMANLTGWTALGTSVDGGTPSGSFTAGNSAFSVSSYGTLTGWGGPAVKQSVPQAPLTDFVVEMDFTFPTITDKVGRVELYMLDSNSNAIGKIAMVKLKRDSGNRVEVRLGGGSTYTFPVNYYGGTRGNEWNNFAGIIRFTRKGNVTEAYIAKVDPTTGKHSRAHNARFVDTEMRYAGNLSQVQVHIGTNNVSNPVPATIRDVKVWKLVEVPDTDPRIIARNGDVIEINHVQSAVFINGQERKDLKDFGAEFFNLRKGTTALLIEPKNSVTASVTIKEAFR